MLENFTDNSDNYLVNVSGYPNDWQYIDWEGFNGPWSSYDSLKRFKAFQPVGESTMSEVLLPGREE